MHKNLFLTIFIQSHHTVFIIFLYQLWQKHTHWFPFIQFYVHTVFFCLLFKLMPTTNLHCFPQFLKSFVIRGKLAKNITIIHSSVIVDWTKWKTGNKSSKLTTWKQSFIFCLYFSFWYSVIERVNIVVLRRND